MTGRKPPRRHGSTSNSVTELEVSRALNDLGITKDVNAYAQTRYDSCMVYCHLPLLRRGRSYSLNEPNSMGMFTNAELLPSLKYVISDGERTKLFLTNIIHFAPFKSSVNVYNTHANLIASVGDFFGHHLTYEDSFFVYLPLAHAVD